MRFETTTKNLRDLVLSFSSGRIQLPQFQRDYVWRPTKIRNLLDSLLRGFPIGGVYLWRPSSVTLDPKPKAVGKIHYGAEFDGYLIDGQQRLTSLEAAYGLYSGEDKLGDELRCYLDLNASEINTGRDTRLFVSYGGNKAVARRVDAGDSTLIPLKSLFEITDPFELQRSTREALQGRPGWNEKRIAVTVQRLDKALHMLDQQVPCTTVFDVSDTNAVEIFSRLNKGGTQLRQGDVRAAELARGPAVGVLKEMRQFVAGERPARLGFGFSFAFRTLVVFHRETAQFLSLKPDWIETSGPHGRSLRESWRAAERALEAALAFVDTTMGWSRRALLPSANALVALAWTLDRADLEIRDDDASYLSRWLCLTALRGTFQGSVETTLNRFLRAVKESRGKPARALAAGLRKNESRRITADELTRNGHMWGPAVQVMHAWLVSRGATDWLDPDKTLDSLARTDSTTSPTGELTVHHIFARELLTAILDNADDANRPANFALVARATNSTFGVAPPGDVLASLTSDQRKIASGQLFGQNAGDLLAVERYSEFCSWRAARLAEALNEFLGLS